MPSETFSTDEEEEEHGLYHEDSIPQMIRSKSAAALERPSVWDWYKWCTSGIVLAEGYDGVTELLDYDSRLLTTVRCLFMRKGTILTKRVVWVEEFFVVLVFLCTRLLTELVLRVRVYAKENMMEQADTLVGICSTLTTITIFLMGTFTVLNFERWQNLRREGVETIWLTGSQLSMVTACFVTKDSNVLSAIDRYTRASLMLIFMQARGMRDTRVLVRRGVLTDDEMQQLEPDADGMFTCMCIWTWVTGIYNGLSKKGFIKSDPLLRYFVSHCCAGQNAANSTFTLLTANVPISYFALISAVVKCHNLSYAIIFGAVSSVQAELHGKTTLVVCTIMWLIVTAVFNALLVVNQDFINPFDGHAMDAAYPMAWLDQSMKQDMANNVAMAQNLPEWFHTAGIAHQTPELSLAKS